jgi:UPF0755 protein
MNRRRILVGAIIVFAVLASTFGFYAWQMLYTPNVLVDQQDRAFLIRSDESYQQVIKRLKTENYVDKLVPFAFLAKLMDYPENVKPGHYVLKANMTNLAAVRLLRSGRQEPLNLTFTNSRTRSELAEKVGGRLMFSKQEIDSLLHSQQVAREYGFDTTTFIGMFLPNTYEFYWTTSARDFLDRMKKEYDKYWTEEREAKAQAMGLTKNEVTTLASIVNAETNMRDEMPRVAGVYLNRLNKNMRLEADPTLVFALGDFTIKRVLKKDKEIDSPYNTYKYVGLPPGPIRMPSISALDGVLNAEDHNYLFFCARPDFSGYHDFAVSYNEHLKNARRYQRALRERGIFR